MKLIIGIGNPGLKYFNTRHNLGFFIIDKYLKENNFKLDKENFNGLFCIENINNQKVIIAKPQTFVNLTGEFVSKIINFYGISPLDILVIVDDKDQDIAKFKLKFLGSANGHNGLKNIILNLKTDVFPRLKIGIGIPEKGIDTARYVLSRFDFKQTSLLEQNMQIYFDIINNFLISDIEDFKNKYNEKN